jgi:hypothetical protein
MKCEFVSCNTEHDGSYGSGRFCSLKCSRAFSTFEKRKSINQKVSITLSKNSKTLINLINSNEVTKEEFIEAIFASTTWRQALTKLGAKLCGSSYSFAKKCVNNWELSTSHFFHPKDSNDWLKIRKGENKGKLAHHLKKIGRKYECEECGLGDEWRGKKITLQVDHINGINYDHRPENLRFLCPNCHSQTSTFCWKNVKKNIGVSSNSKTSDFESLNQGA